MKERGLIQFVSNNKLIDEGFPKDNFDSTAKSWIEVCKDRVGTKIFSLTYVDTKEIEKFKSMNELNDWTFDNQIEYVKTNIDYHYGHQK